MGPEEQGSLAFWYQLPKLLLLLQRWEKLLWLSCSWQALLCASQLRQAKRKMHEKVFQMLWMMKPALTWLCQGKQGKPSAEGKSNKSKDVKRRRRNNKFGRKQQKRNKKNKKVQKGKKNKTRGKAKGRNGKKRNKGRKGKKSKQIKKKGRNGKKMKKSKKNRGKKVVRRQQGTRQQADTCVTDLARLAGVFGNQARKVYRQAGRTATFASKKTSKKGKKDDFKAPADIVLSAVGGNSSNPSCSDSSSNSNATGSLTVLQNCSTNIEALCPTANQTLLDEVAACKTAADNFRNRFSELFVGSKTAAQICTGAKDASILALETTVRGCVTLVKEAEAAQKKEENTCTAAFQSCRREERASVNHVDNCKATCPTSNTTPVPTNSSASATATVAQSTTSAPTVSATPNPGKYRR